MSETSKRKHSSTSSNSDCSLTNTPVISKYFSNAPSQTTEQETEKKEKKEKRESKKFKPVEEGDKMTIEEKLEEISAKLSNVLTKTDKSFIREILCETLEEMKESILASVVHRIEILEGEMHERAVENDKLKEEIAKSKIENENIKQKNDHLKKELRREKEERVEQANAGEQYGRRNNIRITGAIQDGAEEMAEDTTRKVIRFLNQSKMQTNLTAADVDIAHRIGKFKGRNRPILVKLVHRTHKSIIMKKAKLLKGTGVFINEDLTRLNQEMLSSLRIKAPTVIERAWSFEGKLFAKYHNGSVDRIEFKSYREWLTMPWPKTREAQAHSQEEQMSTESAIAGPENGEA